MGNNNNNISIVPEEIGNLVKLSMLDVRNNAIESLPTSMVNLKSLTHTYLYENPICSNGWLDHHEEVKDIVEKSMDAGCNQQCSRYCQDSLLKLKVCIRDCNSAKCDYQNGVCAV